MQWPPSLRQRHKDKPPRTAARARGGSQSPWFISDYLTDCVDPYSLFNSNLTNPQSTIPANLEIELFLRVPNSGIPTIPAAPGLSGVKSWQLLHLQKRISGTP